MQKAYCGECDWQYRVDGDESGELSRAMIDHFVETGHSPVERCDADGRLEKRGEDQLSADQPEPSSEPRPESK